ncbi:hypothetical protein B0F90DRAFT_1918828 [Multifurca ochricompacta]|uniref:Protein kinase domain-containing protein n=1 Tax=Multifurca ochricompacta TaxID=376703 RepID=A0AAD4LZY0_9AGAM|nr:hypothetical protein B0F90DRAFT_1918828 [Multifurca ochricompacta]
MAPLTRLGATINLKLIQVIIEELENNLWVISNQAVIFLGKPVSSSLKSFPHGSSFKNVFTAAYIDSNLQAHKYLVYQPNPSRREFYNLLSMVFVDNTGLQGSLVIQLAKLMKDTPKNLPSLAGPKRKLDSGASGAESDSKKAHQEPEGAQQKITAWLLFKSHHLACQLKLTVYIASSPDDPQVVLKLLDDNSLNKLEILWSLRNVIALPWRMPLVEYCFLLPLVWSAEPLEIQFLEGVAFLHERKITHLDLKPDNVVIDVEGDKHHQRLWIIDFGLSVFVEEEETMIRGYLRDYKSGPRQRLERQMDQVRGIVLSLLTGGLADGCSTISRTISQVVMAVDET